MPKANKIKKIKIKNKHYPLVEDRHGVERLPENRIIKDLLDAARDGKKLDLNDISERYHNERYTLDEYIGLYTQIGYSVGGFWDIFEEKIIEERKYAKTKA